MAKLDAGVSAGMGRAGLKRMLKYARKEPVRAAFALGADGKPIITLDKRKQPRALEKGLKQDAPDSKNHRFGTVMVDPDEPKLARFVINRAASGMAKKLVLALKGTGFNKVRIVLDDGTDVDSAEGEPEEETEDETEDELDDDDTDEGEAETASSEANSSVPYDETSAEASGADQAESKSDQPDAATLTSTLTALVKRMVDVIAADPPKKTALAELATDAQASLKRGDLAQAAACMDVLRQALDIAEGSETPATEQPVEEDAPAEGYTDDSEGGPSEADETPVDATAADENSWEEPPRLEPTDDSYGDAPPPSQDPAALTAVLTELVKQVLPMIAADPSQRDALKGLMTQAQAALKNGDMDMASGHVGSLRAMLDRCRATPAAPDIAAAAAPAIAKARVAWVATRQKVETDVGNLHNAFTSALQGHGMADHLAKAFRSRVDTVLDALDESLAETLDAVNQATDPAQRDELVQQAHALIERYQNHVASDPTIAMLDKNPFASLGIQKTMVATLAALSKAIR